MRPAFLTTPGVWLRTQRMSQSAADYASPITRYKHERSWRICDRFAAGLLVGVLVALALGAL